MKGPYGLPLVVARKVPVRVPVQFERQDDGTVVLIYRKNFTRLERWIYRRFGGVEYIRRPLDHMGTRVWWLCDGEHTVAEICREMERRFGEAVEPIGPRVWGFIRMLAERNIVLILSKKVPLRERKSAPAASPAGATDADVSQSGGGDAEDEAGSGK